MIKRSLHLPIVMADDDKDDQMFARKAFVQSRLANSLHIVNDGVELMEYLHRRGEFESMKGMPLPALILLDLNMPRMDGREALDAIKSDTSLRHIPVVVLTTSKQEKDIYRSYDIGANSFITKPVTFQGLVDVIQGLEAYWFEIVTLPQ